MRVRFLLQTYLNTGKVFRQIKKSGRIRGENGSFDKRLRKSENFCQNENYFQIRPPKITALLCPFPALSPAETSLFPRNFAESSIVGYQTTTLTKGANKSFALQFESLENPGQAVRIDNLFPGTTFKAGASWTAADQIWAWDATANNWAKYAYYENKRVTPVVPAGWYKYNFLTDKSFVAVTDADKVAAGEGFLYIRNQSGTNTITWNAITPAE